MRSAERKTVVFTVVTVTGSRKVGVPATVDQIAITVSTHSHTNDHIGLISTKNKNQKQLKSLVNFNQNFASGFKQGKCILSD